MAFEKLNAFTKDVSDLSNQPALDPVALKAQFDAAPDEVRVYLNKLIDALKLTTDGDSGADNIGATTISGLDGDTVQEILESLKNYSDTNFRTKSDSYTKTEVDNKLPFKGSSVTLNLNPGASQDVGITYPAGRFTDTPILKYSLFNTDVDGAYTMASTIITNNKDGATIRVKNKGTTLQYVMVYYTAQ